MTVFRSVLASVFFGLAAAVPAVGQMCDTWIDGDVAPGFRNPAFGAALWDADGDGPRGPDAVVSVRTSIGLAYEVYRWDGSAWLQLDGVFSDTAGLRLASWDPDGEGAEPAQLVAAGNFTTVGGVPMSRIARWENGAWQQLGGGLPSAVRSLTTWDPDGAGPLASCLFAGGNFGVRCWDGDEWTTFGGSIGPVYSATVWDPDGPGPLQEELVVGGGFVARSSGGPWHHFGAGLNQSVLTLTEWDPDGEGPGTGMLVAGGNFYPFEPNAPAGVAIWNGSAWVSMGSGLRGPGTTSVLSLATVDPDDEGPLGPQLFAGGDFSTTQDGALLRGIARWDGSVWRPVDGGFGGGSFLRPAVRTLVTWSSGEHETGGSGMLAVGDFTIAGTLAAGQVAEWTAEGWRTIGHGFGQIISSGVNFRFGLLSTIIEWDDDGDNRTPPLLLGGGVFHTVSSMPAGHLARWTGAAWEPFGPGLAAPVAELAVADFDGDGPGSVQLLAAGGTEFTTIPPPVGYVSLWSGEEWVQMGEQFDSKVEAVMMCDLDGGGPAPAQLIAAGGFTAVGGEAAHFIARWDGERWRPLGKDAVASGLPGPARAVAMWDPDGEGPLPRRLVAAGDVPNPGGAPTGFVSIWDGMTWTPLSQPGLNSGVSDLAVWSGEDGPLLVVAGSFSMAGATQARGIAAWNGLAWLAIGDLDGVSVFKAARLAMWDHDGAGPSGFSLVVVGNFGSVGGVDSNGIARWDGEAWYPIRGAETTGTIEVAPARNGLPHGAPADLFLGKYPPSFHTLNSPRATFARYSSTGPLTITSQPGDAVRLTGEAASFDVSATGNEPLAFRWRRDGVELVDGPSAGGGVIVGAATPTLSISAVRVADGGLYDAVVSDGCGERRSAVARLLIICRADWDGDEMVSSADISAFLSTWIADVQGTDLTADFNRDGAVNSLDISAFLAEWIATATNGC